MPNNVPLCLADLSDNSWPQIKSVSQTRAQEADADSTSASLELFIGSGVAWFNGHFPGHPVLAGVVQLNWATEFGRRLFNLESDFLGVENLKFQRIIEPGTTLLLELEYSDELKRIAFCYADGEGAFSKGRIRFV